MLLTLVEITAAAFPVRQLACRGNRNRAISPQAAGSTGLPHSACWQGGGKCKGSAPLSPCLPSTARLHLPSPVSTSYCGSTGPDNRMLWFDADPSSVKRCGMVVQMFRHEALDEIISVIVIWVPAQGQRLTDSRQASAKTSG